MRWDNVKVISALVLGLAIELTIGAGAAWGLLAVRGPEVEVIEGWTTNVNEAGTGIGVATESDGPVKGYSIAGVFWREAYGPSRVIQLMRRK
jgi:hypothetical protein